MATIIQRKGVAYTAATCDQCGIRIWPADGLKQHKLTHEVQPHSDTLTKAENRKRFTRTKNARWDI